MKYIELGDLVVGDSYDCIFYDGSKKSQLEYEGEGIFSDESDEYSVYGEIRYAVDMADSNCPFCKSTDIKIVDDPYGGSNGEHIQRIDCNGCGVEFHDCSIDRWNDRLCES